MTLSFHPEADDEFLEAIAYYEICESGLGVDFSRAVHAAILNAFEYPRIWPQIEEEVRRCLVHRFPYGVLYSIEPDGIFVLAVMPLRRDPDYWRRRLKRGGT